MALEGLGGSGDQILDAEHGIPPSFGWESITQRLNQLLAIGGPHHPILVPSCWISIRRELFSECMPCRPSDGCNALVLFCPDD